MAAMTRGYKEVKSKGLRVSAYIYLRTYAFMYYLCLCVNCARIQTLRPNYGNFATSHPMSAASRRKLNEE